MDSKSFDDVTKKLGGTTSRRSALKGLVGGLIGVAGLGAAAKGASAATPTISIHSRWCTRNQAKGNMYLNCHNQPWIYVDYAFKGTGGAFGTFYIGDTGNGGITVPAGTYTLAEEADTVAVTKGVYVYCSENGTKKVLFDGRADTGKWTFKVASGQKATCDVYNILKKNPV